MLVVLAVCALACSDALSRLTEPNHPPPQDSTGIPAPETVTGCATFDVRLNGSSVAVTSVPEVGCGPVTPILAGTATFNSATSTLSIPLALRNDGRLRLHAPAAVSVASDSVVFQTAVGRNHPALSVVQSDSGDIVSRDSVRMNYKTAFPASVVRRTAAVWLPPHGTSSPRTLLVTLPAAASVVHIRVHAMATYVFTVPMDAPSGSADSTLISARAPANILAKDPHFGYRVSREWLWVSFTPTATKEDRQAAIDAVNSTVVGGMRLGSAHRYFVHVPVPSDSGGSFLAHAIATLNAQPGIAHVDADYVDGPVAQ
jgi:hypothetical protein